MFYSLRDYSYLNEIQLIKNDHHIKDLPDAEYLFTNRQCQPLSVNSVYKLFQMIAPKNTS